MCLADNAGEWLDKWEQAGADQSKQIMVFFSLNWIMFGILWFDLAGPPWSKPSLGKSMEHTGPHNCTF